MILVTAGAGLETNNIAITAKLSVMLKFKRVAKDVAYFSFEFINAPPNYSLTV